MMLDWGDISTRLRRKIIEMNAKGALYGFKVCDVTGHNTIILAKNKDVFLKEERGMDKLAEGLK